MAKSKKQKLKEKLWRLTSEYVRKRDCKDFQAGEGKSMASELSKCVTCGIVKSYKELQAGHFIPRAQGLATYFDERNIHSQCYRCNINLGGNGAEYYPYMARRYGEEVVDELRQLSRQVVRFTISDYEEMIENVKNKLEDLND